MIQSQSRRQAQTVRQYWTRHKFVVAVALLLTAQSAAASVLVVRSEGPSKGTYPRGKLLGDRATLTLKPGDRLTIIGSSGALNLRGPKTYSVADLGLSATSMVAAAGRRQRTAAGRAVGGPTPSLWEVNVANSGTVCLPSLAEPVHLWRANMTQSQTLTITAPDGASASFEWPAKARGAIWPAAVAPKEGGEFHLAFSKGGAATTVKFVLLRERPTDPVEASQQLVAKGCEAQLDLLIETGPSVLD